MVFLSPRLWIRSRLRDRFWRKQEVLQHARHFRGRKNRCYSLAVRAVRRAFVYATIARRLKKREMRLLWQDRIEAASLEHGVKYRIFISNLAKVSCCLFMISSFQVQPFRPLPVLPCLVFGLNTMFNNTMFRGTAWQGLQ
uniref:Mitochondrial ribosomal protein L20 n=1 Tax=Varanus komodoensis TaxID=61221 RepID=A0A8D2LE06_VARKO